MTIIYVNINPSYSLDGTHMDTYLMQCVNIACAGL